MKDTYCYQLITNMQLAIVHGIQRFVDGADKWSIKIKAKCFIVTSLQMYSSRYCVVQCSSKIALK